MPFATGSEEGLAEIPSLIQIFVLIIGCFGIHPRPQSLSPSSPSPFLFSLLKWFDSMIPLGGFVSESPSDMGKIHRIPSFIRILVLIIGCLQFIPNHGHWVHHLHPHFFSLWVWLCEIDFKDWIYRLLNGLILWYHLEILCLSCHRIWGRSIESFICHRLIRWIRSLRKIWSKYFSGSNFGLLRTFNYFVRDNVALFLSLIIIIFNHSIIDIKILITGMFFDGLKYLMLNMNLSFYVSVRWIWVLDMPIALKWLKLNCFPKDAMFQLDKVG